MEHLFFKIFSFLVEESAKNIVESNGKTRSASDVLNNHVGILEYVERNKVSSEDMPEEQRLEEGILLSLLTHLFYLSHSRFSEK